MSSDWNDFLSRDEVLGGIVARRASTLLFAIESRTAASVGRSRRALATYLTEKSAAEAEREFIDALAQGREPPLRPTIQDIERYAPQWEALVPADPGLRAALARMLGAKYRLIRRWTPNIVAALGLDDPDVQSRFETLYGEPITTVYADRPSLGERWRWLRSAVSSRLENLPPFWMVFAVTLTETVGAGILALPIAFADVGPIAGIVAIVVLGIVNIMTIAALSEAIARNGSVRYGRAYFGRMVHEYLGPAGVRLLTPSLLLLTIVILLSYFIGFASTLADATGIRGEVWTTLLLLVLLFFLRRETLSATVASALVVGAASLALILSLSIIALPQVELAHLRHANVPFLDGRPFDRSVLQLVFGVVLMAYFGHTTTANVAALVLHRDTTGRSLIRGSVWAFVIALCVYVVWVFAVNGAVPAERLAGETGTALAPLADQVGPVVLLLGVVFVSLAMGMAAIHISLGLSYQVRDWLPNPSTSHNGGVGIRAALREWLLLPGTQRIAGFIPTVVIFIFVQGLFLAGRESFAGMLGFLGVITAPIVAGVFAMLMLYASRRKGDCAVEGGWRFLGHPAVVIGVSVLFVMSIMAHGLFIWDDPFRQIVALCVSVAVIVALLRIRRSAFVPRAVIEVRLDSEGGEAPVVNVVSNGRMIPSDVQWVASSNGTNDPSDSRMTAQVEIPALEPGELRIWVHKVSDGGVSESLGAEVSLDGNGAPIEAAVDASVGEAIFPIDGGPWTIRITNAGVVLPQLEGAP